MKKYTLDEVYTADMTAFQRERYNRVADEFEKLFGEKPTAFFSAPGRTEVGGNHTDHNFGCVLAAHYLRGAEKHICGTYKRYVRRL